MDTLHRIVSGAVITPFELRCAGMFALVWFCFDVFWFVYDHWMQ